jgi:hypothetical protein
MHLHYVKLSQWVIHACRGHNDKLMNFINKKNFKLRFEFLNQQLFVVRHVMSADLCLSAVRFNSFARYPLPDFFCNSLQHTRQQSRVDCF